MQQIIIIVIILLGARLGRSCTGKSLSEALLFAEHGGEHVVYKNCSECQTISVHNMLSPGLSLEFSCIELVIQ